MHKYIDGKVVCIAKRWKFDSALLLGELSVMKTTDGAWFLEQVDHFGQHTHKPIGSVPEVAEIFTRYGEDLPEELISELLKGNGSD